MSISVAPVAPRIASSNVSPRATRAKTMRGTAGPYRSRRSCTSVPDSAYPCSTCRRSPWNRSSSFQSGTRGPDSTPSASSVWSRSRHERAASIARPSSNHRGTRRPPLARWMSTCATSCASTSSRPPSGYDGARAARRTPPRQPPPPPPPPPAGPARANGDDSGARTTRMSGPGTSRPTSSITLATHGRGPAKRRFADGGRPGWGSVTRRVGSAAARSEEARRPARTQHFEMTTRVLRLTALPTPGMIILNHCGRPPGGQTFGQSHAHDPRDRYRPPRRRPNGEGAGGEWGRVPEHGLPAVRDHVLRGEAVSGAAFRGPLRGQGGAFQGPRGLDVARFLARGRGRPDGGLAAAPAPPRLRERGGGPPRREEHSGFPLTHRQPRRGERRASGVSAMYATEILEKKRLCNIGSYEERLGGFNWAIAEKEMGWGRGDPLNIGWHLTDRICRLGLARKPALLWEGSDGA